jgi:serine protease Do
MEQLLKNGAVHRGYLGVLIKDVEDPELAARLGLKDQHGVLVSQVMDNAPAANGGMQSGDIITAVNGKPVKDGRELQRTVAALPLGKPVEVVVVRDGQPKTLHVTVEEQPAEATTKRVRAPRVPERNPSAVSIDKAGFEAADLTPETADALGFKESTKGVVITKVELGSMASEAGLRRGMLITRVEKQPVTTAEALRDQLAKADLAKGVLLQVQTPQGGVNFVLLKSAAATAKP